MTRHTRGRGRPRRIGVAAAAAAALTLMVVSACGGGATTGTGSTDSPAANTSFPTTLTHKYGTTTITAAPQRVVTIGLTDQDAVLALGVVPVGITKWLGDYPSGVGPWAQDKLGGATAELVGDAATIDFEKITALKPDLVLGLYSGITAEQYGLLSRIAPTVAQPGEDYTISWEEQTRLTGQALGKSSDAEELVTQTQALFTDAKQAHPEFTGKTAAFSVPTTDGQFGVYSESYPFQALLTSLGFALPPAVADVIPAGALSGTISGEQLGVLGSADVVLWNATASSKAEIEASPVYRSSEIDKHSVFLLDTDTPPLSHALAFRTVLSLPYLLDGLTPKLSAALTTG